MRRHIGCLLLCNTLVVSIWCEWATGQFNPKPSSATSIQQSVKDLQLKALASYKPDLFALVLKTPMEGFSSAEANIKTGEVWVLSMSGVPTYTHYLAYSGFVSGALKNMGPTMWTGVTITATFQVVVMKGEGILQVGHVERPDGTMGEFSDAAIAFITNPGTYQVTSRVFTMKPHTEYAGYAKIVVGGSGPNVPAGCYAKITSMKFNFP